MEPPWVKLHEIQGDVAPAIWPKLDENRHGEHWVRNRSAESKLFPSFARGVGGERYMGVVRVKWNPHHQQVSSLVIANQLANEKKSSKQVFWA